MCYSNLLAFSSPLEILSSTTVVAPNYTAKAWYILAVIDDDPKYVASPLPPGKVLFCLNTTCVTVVVVKSVSRRTNLSTGQEDDNDINEAIENVRNMRRRLALAPPPPLPADGGGTSASTRGISRTAGGGFKAADETGGGRTGGAVSAVATRKVEINNADLAELMRSTKPRGSPGSWARVLYRAKYKLPGAHAGGMGASGAGGGRATGRRTATRVTFLSDFQK